MNIKKAVVWILPRQC